MDGDTVTAVTAPATDAARIGPPAGWDPDEAAERIRVHAAEIAGLYAAVRSRRPLWADGRVERLVAWVDASRRPTGRRR